MWELVFGALAAWDRMIGAVCIVVSLLIFGQPVVTSREFCRRLNNFVIKSEHRPWWQVLTTFGREALDSQIILVFELDISGSFDLYLWSRGEWVWHCLYKATSKAEQQQLSRTALVATLMCVAANITVLYSTGVFLLLARTLTSLMQEQRRANMLRYLI